MSEPISLDELEYVTCEAIHHKQTAGLILPGDEIMRRFEEAALDSVLNLCTELRMLREENERLKAAMDTMIDDGSGT